jgi:hypothetical protein
MEILISLTSGNYCRTALFANKVEKTCISIQETILPDAASKEDYISLKVSSGPAAGSAITSEADFVFMEAREVSLCINKYQATEILIKFES